MPSNEKTLLEKPLNQLAFSAEFIAVCHGMGYRTVAEILADGPEKIQEKKKFSYRWLAELTRFLKENGSLGSLQPTPGNNQPPGVPPF